MDNKPCKRCNRNLIEAILFDEVTCYANCHAWHDWQDRLNRAAEILVGAARPEPEPVLVSAS